MFSLPLLENPFALIPQRLPSFPDEKFFAPLVTVLMFGHTLTLTPPHEYALNITDIY
jgi:hypothetical protein